LPSVGLTQIVQSFTNLNEYCRRIDEDFFHEILSASWFGFRNSFSCCEEFSTDFVALL
jgi:hypothetical protein